MSKKDVFIAQDGTIVYWVNDKGSNCVGCCFYQQDRAVSDCSKVVPAEHVDPYYACIQQVKIYKRLEAND